MSDGSEIGEAQLQLSLDAGAPLSCDQDHNLLKEHEAPGLHPPTDIKSHERDLILRSLSERGGNRTATAEQLGMSARTLRYKLARMRDAGVDIPPSKPSRGT